jgi:hypothetical protein
MHKLTEIQLVILSAAAQRDGGAALPLPNSIKLQGAALSRVLKSLLSKGLLDEQPAGNNAAVWRESKVGRRLTLVITDAGRAEIGVETDQAAKERSATGAASADKHRVRTKRSAAIPKSKRKPQRRAVRSGTKQSLLVDLLQRKEGASLAEAVKATGWQAHSVRGTISGALKKTLGLTVVANQVEGRGRVYRIAAKR